MTSADIGLVGLAVMGQNLVLNMADHGFTVAAHNRTTESARRVPRGSGQGRVGGGCAEPRGARRDAPAAAPHHAHGQGRPAGRRGDRPARAPARSRATSSSTAATRSTPTPSAASRELAEHGLHFVGVGVSGGEEGARHGPSIMPGGDRRGLEAPCRASSRRSPPARPDGTPCCDWRRARRRRALREDGAQRHRVRRHAADRRGLRVDDGRRARRRSRDGRRVLRLERGRCSTRSSIEITADILRHVIRTPGSPWST